MGEIRHDSRRSVPVFFSRSEQDKTACPAGQVRQLVYDERKPTAHQEKTV